MASVNFYLKGASSKNRLLEIKDKKFLNIVLDTPRQLFLMLSTGGVRLQIYTKKRIPQKYWNFEKQEIDCSKYRNVGIKIQEWLDDLKTEVRKLAEANELEKIQTTKSELVKILSGKILPKTKAGQFDIQVKEFLIQHKTASGHSLRNNTLKKYNGLFNHLKSFSLHKGISINLNLFDKEFLESFKTYLTDELELNDNTVAKYIKAAKPLIRYYMNHGLIKPYELAQVKSNEKEGEIYVLGIKNVLMLQNLSLEAERHKHARDIFCFMCWTGQRYSDYESLKHEDFTFKENGEKVWELITTKTGTRVSIPIVEYAEDILIRNKNCDTPLPKLSNQKMNEYLKEIGKIAELNFPVKSVKYYDGKKTEKKIPFYKILTSHVARKSYITNSLMLGVPERVVKDVSGHKDEKSFRRYVQLAGSYKSEMINKAFDKKNISKFLLET